MHCFRACSQSRPRTLQDGGGAGGGGSRARGRAGWVRGEGAPFLLLGKVGREAGTEEGEREGEGDPEEGGEAGSRQEGGGEGVAGSRGRWHRGKHDSGPGCGEGGLGER